MKYRTTGKAVRTNFDAVKVGYCDVQDIFRNITAEAYICGVDGWKADIYTKDGKAIVTGYQPTGRKPRLTFDQIRTLEKAAAAIWGDWSLSYEQQAAHVEAIRNKLFELI